MTAGPRTPIARSTVTGRRSRPPAKIEERLQIAPGAAVPARRRCATRIAAYVTWMRHRRYYEAAARERQPPVFTDDRTEVDLTVDVEPGPLVTVEFTGDPLPKDKIAELVPIEREGSVDQDLLEDSARRITDYLQPAGLLESGGRRRPSARKSDGKLTLVFNVQRGALFRVAPGGVEVTGNTSVPIEELRPLLKIVAGRPVRRVEARARSTGAISQIYKTQGIRDGAGGLRGQRRSGDGLVKPVIVVKEGPRVLVGTVTIARQPRRCPPNASRRC